MAEIQTSTWSETAASNNTAAPDGMPEGMAASGVNDWGRESMAALKREWNRTHPTISSAGTSTAITLTYTTAPAAYVAGLKFQFKVGTTNGATPTLNVNALGAKNIYKIVAGTATQIASGDWTANQIVEVTYDTTLNASAGGFIWSAANPGDALTSQLPMRGYLAGLGTSRNSGTPTTKIDIAVGIARDSTNAVFITAASTLTADCTTTGANALDAGSLANSTWYHVYVISKADGTTASLISTSATAPTMPSGYSYKRRVGSVKTNGSAQFIAYAQLGDLFTWDVPVSDVNTSNPGTSAVTRTLTVATGVVVLAWFSNREDNTSNDRYVLWTALDQTDTTPSSTMFSQRANTAGRSGGDFYVKTNTSAQIRYRTDVSGASDATFATTKGWIDYRGRFD